MCHFSVCRILKCLVLNIDKYTVTLKVEINNKLSAASYQLVYGEDEHIRQKFGRLKEGPDGDSEP